MLNHYRKSVAVAAVSLLLAGTAQAAITELAVNGGFETGDFTGWTQFPSGGTTQAVSTVNPSSGIYSGNLGIPAGAGAVNNVLKQANLAAGLLVPGQSVFVSFDIRGSLGPGAVVFAENFSELSGGGVSFNDLIAVHPLMSTDPDAWVNVAYTTVLGPDVSGGFTLQFAAICGAVPDCSADIFIDNVSITADVAAIPVPAAVWLFASALGLLGWGKRRAS